MTPCPPKVIILLTLLVSWMEDPVGIDYKQDIQCIEYFAGVGRIAQLSAHVGYTSIGFDIDYGTRRRGKRSPMDLNSNAGLVLAIRIILRSSFNDLAAMFAVVCSSFVPVNRGTGGRDLLVPEGDENVPSVRRGNKLLCRILVLNPMVSFSIGKFHLHDDFLIIYWIRHLPFKFDLPPCVSLPRSVILMLLVICVGGTVMMENPQNSLIGMHSRFAWLVALLRSHNIPVIWLQIL